MTRSLTIICDDSGNEIAVLYRHSDGYPTAHGLDLKRFLSCFTITNGIGVQTMFERKRKFANGMYCLAAQIISHFKQGIGTFYLYPSGTRNLDEEYRFTVYRDQEGIKMKAEARFQKDWHLLFEGLIEWFDADHAEESWRETRNQLQDSVNHQSQVIDEDDSDEDLINDQEDESEDFFICEVCRKRVEMEEARMLRGGGAVCDDCSINYPSCQLCEYYFPAKAGEIVCQPCLESWT